MANENCSNCQLFWGSKGNSLSWHSKIQQCRTNRPINTSERDVTQKKVEGRKIGDRSIRFKGIFYKIIIKFLTLETIKQLQKECPLRRNR